MGKFKPLSSGMFSVMGVNRKLRQIWSELEAIKAIVETNRTACTETEAESIDENAIRQMAKEQGVKSWHVKSIAKLQAELESMEA